MRNSFRYMIMLFVSIYVGAGIFVEGAGAVERDPIIPQDIALKEGFEPGFEAPIGSALEAEGQVFVYHRDTKEAYVLKNYFPLFKGDTILTGGNGKLRFKLNDASELTLSPAAVLVLDRHVYEIANESRSSFMNLVKGTSRFLVQKMKGSGRSDFKVKTQTAVMGVRGSDFAVESAPGSTSITTFENTLIEVRGLKMTPEGLQPGDLMLLDSNRQVRVGRDGSFSDVIEMVADDIIALKESFDFRGQEKPRAAEGLLETPAAQPAAAEGADSKPPRTATETQMQYSPGTSTGETAGETESAETKPALPGAPAEESAADGGRAGGAGASILAAAPVSSEDIIMISKNYLVPPEDLSVSGLRTETITPQAERVERAAAQRQVWETERVKQEITIEYREQYTPLVFPDLPNM